MGSLMGHVVEFYRPPSNLTLGLVANIASERQIAVVRHERDGWLVCEGGERIRVFVKPDEVTANLGEAKSGWGSW